MAVMAEGTYLMGFMAEGTYLMAVMAGYTVKKRKIFLHSCGILPYI
jgi:hypothetical protein